MNFLTIYALTVLPNFHTLAFVAAVLAASFVGLALVMYPIAVDILDDKVQVSKSIKAGLIVACCAGGTAAITPNDQQMMVIVAGHYLTNSELAKLPDDIAVALRKQIAKWSEDEPAK